MYRLSKDIYGYYGSDRPKTRFETLRMYYLKHCPQLAFVSFIARNNAAEFLRSRETNDQGKEFNEYKPLVDETSAKFFGKRRIFLHYCTIAPGCVGLLRQMTVSPRKFPFCVAAVCSPALHSPGKKRENGAENPSYFSVVAETNLGKVKFSHAVFVYPLPFPHFDVRVTRNRREITKREEEERKLPQFPVLPNEKKRK